MAKTKRTQEDRWQPAFYETARGERPAWDFLTGKKTPIDVRIELLTTVRAVLQIGPPSKIGLSGSHAYLGLPGVSQ